MSTRLRVVLLVAALAAGANYWTAAAARAALSAETEHAAALTERDDAILRRIVIKEDLADELTAGRAALAEVAERFEELSADEPAHQYILRTSVRGDSDRERAARNVIEYCAARVSDPAARAALQARLEAELALLPDAD